MLYLRWGGFLVLVLMILVDCAFDLLVTCLVSMYSGRSGICLFGFWVWCWIVLLVFGCLTFLLWCVYCFGISSRLLFWLAGCFLLLGVWLWLLLLNLVFVYLGGLYYVQGLTLVFGFGFCYLFVWGLAFICWIVEFYYICCSMGSCLFGSLYYFR